MKKDAVFINGPFLEGFSRESRSPAVTKSGTLYYPAWLAYACGFAEENGFDCKLIDSIADKISFINSVDLVVKLNPKISFPETSKVLPKALEETSLYKNSNPYVRAVFSFLDTGTIKSPLKLKTSTFSFL